MNHRDYCYNVLLNSYVMFIHTLAHDVKYEHVFKLNFIHLLSHTNKCTNYIIYYLKLVLIIGIKTLSSFHSSYMFRHITCHPQGTLMFLAKITGKTICKKWAYIVWRVWQHIMNSRVHACSVCYWAVRHSSTHCTHALHGHLATFEAHKRPAHHKTGTTPLESKETCNSTTTSLVGIFFNYSTLELTFQWTENLFLKSINSVVSELAISKTEK
jgi:hypothetical protein